MCKEKAENVEGRGNSMGQHPSDSLFTCEEFLKII